MQERENQEEIICQIYNYAMNLLVNAEKTPQEVKIRLVEKGLAEQDAEIIVTNIVRQIRNIKANKDILYGTLWCFGGLLVTWLSYELASENGSYIAFYGAIIFGAFQFIKGLFYKFFVK